MRYSWNRDDVDERLKVIMRKIYKNCPDVAAYYKFKANLVMGANIAGFEKVTQSIIMHGVV